MLKNYTLLSVHASILVSPIDDDDDENLVFLFMGVRFIIGFFFAGIPWYVGAFVLLCTIVDHREKPGYVACTIAVSSPPPPLAARPPELLVPPPPPKIPSFCER